jgi:hypothetical protein
MNPSVEEDFIRICVSYAGHLRLVGQYKLNGPAATRKAGFEVGKIKVGIKGVGTDPHLGKKRLGAIDKANPPNASSVDICDSVAVREVQSKADVGGLFLSRWNPSKGSGRAEMHNNYVACAEAKEKIFSMPKDNAEATTLEPALSVFGTALEACRVRNDNARNAKVCAVKFHYPTKVIYVG